MMRNARRCRRERIEGDHVLIIAERAHGASVWVDMRDTPVAHGVAISTIVARTGTNATQGTGAKQPTFDARTGCAVFDGVDDCLLSNAGLTANDKVSAMMFAHAPSPAGGFVGVEHTALYYSSNGFVIGTSGANPNAIVCGFSGTGASQVTDKQGAVVASPFAVVFAGDRSTNPDTLQMTQSKGFYTGAYANQNNSSGNFANSTLNIGSRNNGASVVWPGRIGCVFVVKGLLSASEQQAIVQKYQLARAS